MTDKTRKLTKEEETRFEKQIKILTGRVRTFVLGYKLRIRANERKLTCQMKLSDGWVNVGSIKQ